MNKIGVMHVLDTLALGGAERAAVDLVNHLPLRKYRTYLCTTRAEGPLSEAVALHVGRLALERKTRFVPEAFRRLLDFIRGEKIAILHAHGSSLFVATLAAAAVRPHPVVIWHAHYGRPATEDRRAPAHRLALRGTRGVIAVNRQLSDWCRRRLDVPADRIWYIPNMVCAPANASARPDLPGISGLRIVCVANVRVEKDHPNLIRAMAIVVRKYPQAHLILAGAYANSTNSAGWRYLEVVRQEIYKHSLEHNVSFLGQCNDVPAILRSCDIGVLSSKTEGFPVSLLEYGMASLPVVATRVGECQEILDLGRAGIVVSPESPEELARALLFLLGSPQQRTALGKKFSARVKRFYNAETIIDRVCGVYDAVLQANHASSAYEQAAQHESWSLNDFQS